MHQRSQQPQQEQLVCTPDEQQQQNFGSNANRNQAVSFTFPSGTVLRLGSSGELVRKLQEILKTFGYAIAVDGSFGNQTHNFLRQYQRSKGLFIDGVAGPSTLQSLGGTQAQGPTVGGQEIVPAQECKTKHLVFPGDSFWSIAQHYYGDGSRWREIAEANNLTSYSVLRVGQELNIPNVPEQQETPTSSTTSSPSSSNAQTSGSGDVPTPTQTAQPQQDENKAPTNTEGSSGMAPQDQIPLNQHSGLNRTMAEIYNKYGAFIKTKASGLGISTAAAAAVLKCESNGQAFSGGKMIIRFENHIFYDQWGKNAPQTYSTYFSGSSSWKNHKFRRSANDPWEAFHGNQTKEWEVLELARSLNDTAALKSISMGAAQIMGFNHATLGYDTVQDMFESMCTSLPKQIDGMFAFIEKNSTCMRGLRNNDYVTFARGYNGSGQASTYGSLISAAAAAYANVTRGRSSS